MPPHLKPAADNQAHLLRIGYRAALDRADAELRRCRLRMAAVVEREAMVRRREAAAERQERGAFFVFLAACVVFVATILSR